ncbi:hypothetical protein LINGRAHAP2_LOCUS11127 [Linum grandiflorum]
MYSDRAAAAFLELVKLNKAVTDAETTVKLNPQWEKVLTNIDWSSVYFWKGCVLEAMEQYDDALASFQKALQYNSQSAEVSRKIKRITQLGRDKKRAHEVESMRSNIDIVKHLNQFKAEMPTVSRKRNRAEKVFTKWPSFMLMLPAYHVLHLHYYSMKNNAFLA